VLSDLMRLALSRTKEAFTFRGAGSMLFSFSRRRRSHQNNGYVGKENWKNRKRKGSSRIIEREKRDLRVEDSGKQRDNMKHLQ